MKGFLGVGCISDSLCKFNCWWRCQQVSVWQEDPVKFDLV